jgi:hypothetical protein
MKRIFWLVLVVVLVAVFAWGYFTNSFPAPFPSASPRASATTTMTVSTTTPAGFQLGKQFTYGDAVYTVNRTGNVAEINSSSGKSIAAGIYILVYLTVTDQAAVPLELGPADFALVDSSGHLFTVDQKATGAASESDGLKDILTDSLQPGLSRQGVLAFDVPKDATEFSLRLYSGYVSVGLGK